ncbi:MAG: hypothetical protein HN778_08480 [Prolixibacteraceae bacterium]|jgi:hypothetical protein|nr:hypothetical protein [Prolixibacteraceae bacterium]MBT6007227.1 hypothetical protein [Prolixibacteraceae bacterium]MBT6765904.1 hypothetical protein [Prolixibacteraceae bacterium]MBT6999069.1 hypothetical protein [Prolixibacteraceae bacterium]MBT7394850.1 hypothetical protein [Prolixibacteraceae bacterium]
MKSALKNKIFHHKLLQTFNAIIIFVIALNLSCTPQKDQVDDQFSHAQTRVDDLQLSIYITAHAVRDLLDDETGRREALSIFRCNGITKAYIEVYRGGLTVDKNLLIEVKSFFLKNNIEVVGGIATVPGVDFGVKQEGQLGWFNWQHPKTQEDLKGVMRMSASVFDEFIVDDFLCTGDTSMISKAAKGERSWSQYRLDLLSKLSTEIFIEPAKEVNPDITMIIKYPQWYDRFHVFGYDAENFPKLFDKVWVGTESRGQYTQRFGFVQPYEGFVSYRWMDDIAGEKMAGAWFDHGDCDKNDFIEQAWQTVLAGAKEIVFFNYYDFINGHAAHHLIRSQFNELADLAKYVAVNPVEGVAAYKPQHSDAGGDLYIMDFIGTLGIPLVPHFQYPENAKVVFLPTQAAKDNNIFSKIEKSLNNGATMVFTTGFLANTENGKQIAELAGVEYPIEVAPIKADGIINNGIYETVLHGLDLEGTPVLTNGKSLLNAVADSKQIPFFIKSEYKTGTVFTLNSHTFSQVDFDAVGEVLLCPKPLGLLEIPETWSNIVRNEIVKPLNFELLAPTRIVVQPTGNSAWMFHNYNQAKKDFVFVKTGLSETQLINGFTGDILPTNGDTLKLSLQARSRMWVKKVNN